jgi:hypothetical protein
MKLSIQLTKFRLHKKLVEKLSVPTPTTDFEIGGNLEIERFESHTPGWACNGQPDEIGYVNYSFYIFKGKHQWRSMERNHGCSP